MSTKVVTGAVRLSYVHVFEPFSFEGEEPKYSVMVLVPKDDKETIQKLRKAEKAAADIGVSTKWGGKRPKEVASIIRDGDEEDLEKHPEREGHLFFTTRTNNRPGVVDAAVNPIMDASEVYSGCYARVSLNAFPYKFGGNSGVSFALNNLQKVADGEPLGGTTRPGDDFDEYDDESDLI